MLDHGLLALQGSPLTSYNIHVGVMGNWSFMVMDGILAVILFALFRRRHREGAAAT